MNFDLDGLGRDLSIFENFASELDSEKQFNMYLIGRELLFSILSNIDNDPLVIRILSYRLGELLSDFMIIDRAYVSNLYHYINLRLSKDLFIDEQKFFIKDIDVYIRPKGNKQISDLDRFCAAFFIFKCSYQNNYTSKDEARNFIGYMFGLTETDARSSTKKFINSFAKYETCDNDFYGDFKDILEAIFFWRFHDVLSKRKGSFEGCFIDYQNQSSKKDSTTFKTFKAYEYLKRDIIENAKPYLNWQDLQLFLMFTRFKSLSIPNPELLENAFFIKTPSEVSEREMFYLPLLKKSKYLL